MVSRAYSFFEDEFFPFSYQGNVVFIWRRTKRLFSLRRLRERSAITLNKPSYHNQIKKKLVKRLSEQKTIDAAATQHIIFCSIAAWQYYCFGDCQDFVNLGLRRGRRFLRRLRHELLRNHCGRKSFSLYIDYHTLEQNIALIRLFQNGCTREAVVLLHKVLSIHRITA